MITKNAVREKFAQIRGLFKNNVESAPVPAFFVGVAAGALAMLLRAYIFPIAVLGAIVFVGIWLFAEDGSSNGSTSSRRAPGQVS